MDGRLPVAPAADKRARKPMADASALAEEVAKKKNKNVALVPRRRPVPQTPSPATPMATPPVCPTADVGYKGRGHQVVDELPSR